MGKIKRFILRAKQTKEQIALRMQKRRELAELKEKRRAEKLQERLDRTIAIEKRQAKLRSLRKKYMPKFEKGRRPSPAQSGFGPGIISMGNGPSEPERPMQVLPSFEEPKKKKKNNDFGFDF